MNDRPTPKTITGDLPEPPKQEPPSDFGSQYLIWSNFRDLGSVKVSELVDHHGVLYVSVKEGPPLKVTRANVS